MSIMPNPFPGVDPYLESQGLWPDFHLRFMNYWCEAIAEVLPEPYDIRMDERVTLLELAGEELKSAKAMRPDLAIGRPRPASAIPSAAPRPAEGALALEPVSIPVAILDERLEVYLEVRRRPDRTLVAVMELLSPGNKAEPGRGEYLAKRNAILRQPVHLVELDLLAGGRRLPMARPLPPGDYFALVARGDRRPDCDVYAWSIRQALPIIRIPLQAPDPDLPIDLARVLATAYERGRYTRTIDYRAPLALPLSAGERAWAEAQARTALGP